MSCLPPLPAGTDAQPVTVLDNVDLSDYKKVLTTLLDDTPVNTSSTTKTLENKFIPIQEEPGSPKTTFIPDAEKDVIEPNTPGVYDGIVTPTGDMSENESSDGADIDTKLSRTPGNTSSSDTSSDDNQKLELRSPVRQQKRKKHRTTLAVLSSEDDSSESDSDCEDIKQPTHSTKAPLQVLQKTALRKFKRKSKKIKLDSEQSKNLPSGEKKTIVSEVKKEIAKILVDLPKPPKKLIGDAYKIACENINHLL